MLADLRELLTALAGRYGTPFRRAVFSGVQFSGQIIILVNGRNVHYLQGLDTSTRGGRRSLDLPDGGRRLKNGANLDEQYLDTGCLGVGGVERWLNAS